MDTLPLLYKTVAKVAIFTISGAVESMGGIIIFI
jgi:hypothetical protein